MEYMQLKYTSLINYYPVVKGLRFALEISFWSNGFFENIKEYTQNYYLRITAPLDLYGVTRIPPSMCGNPSDHLSLPYFQASANSHRRPYIF